MCTMDLSVNQGVIRVHQRYETNYGSHVFKLQEAYEETDIAGNNNFFNSLKTETSNDHVDDSPLLFPVDCSDDKNFKVDNSLFSYSSFKKAMDLRIHNRTVDGGKRTIFDDAEYFARNFCYKLLPITFEQVDETIIHIEHNYSLCSLNSESEPEEDCSRTMDYSQIREKNYKKRKTKFRENSDQEEEVIYENCQDYSSPVLAHPGLGLSQQPHDENFSPSSEQENPLAGQPLDLSAAPVVQEEKTEPLSSTPEETGQPDSDKENVSAELSGIRVTITRPDEKENYQPCDLFLNDIARLVPWLIDKDCLEVDILDRTCDRHDEFRKHRLYYVIAESTWRSFQSTSERVILTNDKNLGEPLRKMEKNERPSYLIFDQLSLAKCLAEYCQEIGGCFEYRCVEEESDGVCMKEDSGVLWEPAEEEETSKTLEPEMGEPSPVEGVTRDKDEGREKGEERRVLNVLAEEERSGLNELASEEERRDLNESAEEERRDLNELVEEEKNKAIEKEKKKETAWKKEEEERTMEDVEKEANIMGKEEQEKKNMIETMGTMIDEEPESLKVVGIEEKKKSRGELRNDTNKTLRKRCEKSKFLKVPLKSADEVTADFSLIINQEKNLSDTNEAEKHSVSSTLKKLSKEKQEEHRVRTRRNKSKKMPPIEPEPKNNRITTRSMSTSEFETSQKSDKRVIKKEGKKRRSPTPPRQEPSNKRKRISEPEEAVRNRRATLPPHRAEAMTKKNTASKKSGKKNKKSQKEISKRRRENRKKVERRGSIQNTGRDLRSRAKTTNEKIKPACEKAKSTSSRRSRWR